MTPDVEVPVIAAGLCGSDLQRYRAGFAKRSLGHELVGRDPRTGVLAAIRPLRPCRRCQLCQRGWTEQCGSDHSIGRYDTGMGGFSGMVQVGSDQLYPIGDSMEPSLATLADPLACVLHALHGVDVATTVLVIGDGPMAAIAATYARHCGATEVTIAVKHDDRIDRMASFGNRVVAGGGVLPDHYDVVVESVGGISSEPILTAVAAVAPLGRVIALGVYPPQATADLPVRKLLEKESLLRGSKAYRLTDSRDDFASALALLASSPSDFAPIVTSTPEWSLDDPRHPDLDAGRRLKTVYVRRSHLTD